TSSCFRRQRLTRRSFTNVPFVLCRSSRTNASPSGKTQAWWLDTAGVSITIALSCSRPIVTDDDPIPYSFGDAPSSCSVSVAIAVLLELRRRRFHPGPRWAVLHAPARLGSEQRVGPVEKSVAPPLTRKKQAAAASDGARRADMLRLC